MSLNFVELQLSLEWIPQRLVNVSPHDLVSLAVLHFVDDGGFDCGGDEATEAVP
jgi:hypothetical protein